MAISTEHKEMLNRWCEETLHQINKEMDMVEEEAMKMSREPSRCKICDYERMVKSRHYLWETIHEILAIKGLVG